MRPTKIRRKGDKSELIFYCLLVALPLLQICIFYFYVNFNSILMSFQKYSKVTDTFTFDFGVNFSEIWYDLTKQTILLDALKNSIVVWIFTSGVGTFLSILFSYYIFKKWLGAKMFKFFLKFIFSSL